MGFYGNITNTVRSSFYFDRTYPNRKTMDDNCDKDGVFVGRYILVNYEESETYIPLQPDKAQTSSASPVNQTQEDLKGNNETLSLAALNENDAEQDDDKIFKDEASVEMVRTEIYIKNYNIDIKAYGPSRGYDSTVWQKTYVNGQQKYVMIAELNTVVPTFALKADAPTTVPLKPHFDADSTNVYYLIHYQPAWGFRIKLADNQNRGVAVIPESDDEDPRSYDVTDYALSKDYGALSDQTIEWKTTSIVKDKKGKYVEKILYYNGTNWSNYSSTLDGAIYYNLAGFDPTVNIINTAMADKIAITPGYSGQLYSGHANEEPAPAYDTQELEISLPSIGNTIAKVWNIVYGEGKENENKTKIRNNNIIYQDAPDSFFTDNNKEPNTLAGDINLTNSLMGMIIVPVDENTKIVAQDKNSTDQKFEFFNTIDFGRLNDYFIYHNIKTNKYYYKKYNPTLVEVDNLGPVYTSVVDINPNEDYWYCNFRGNYIRETHFSGIRQYYDVKPTERVSFSEKIDDMGYYIFKNNSYIPATEENKKQGALYELAKATPHLPIYYPDGKNLMYFDKDGNMQLADENYNPEIDYFFITQEWLNDPNNYVDSYRYENDKLVPVRAYNKEAMRSLIIPQFAGSYNDPGKKYYKKNDQGWYVEINFNNYTFGDTDYTIITAYPANWEEGEGESVQYEPNKYWFYDESNHNYVKDDMELPRQGVKYYKGVLPKAYRRIGDIGGALHLLKDCKQTTITVTNNGVSTNKQVYSYNPDFYIVSSSNNQYHENEKYLEDEIKPGVTVGYLTEGYSWEELDDYALYYTTINGLLLGLYHFLYGGSKYDTNTVAGMIQWLKDADAEEQRHKEEFFRLIGWKVDENDGAWTGNTDTWAYKVYEQLYLNKDSDDELRDDTWAGRFDIAMNEWDAKITEQLTDDKTTDANRNEVFREDTWAGQFGQAMEDWQHGYEDLEKKWDDEFTKQLTEEKNDAGEYRTDTWAGQIEEKIHNLEATNNTWNTTLSETNDKWDDTFTEQFEDDVDENGDYRDDTWVGQFSKLRDQLEHIRDDYAGEIIQLQGKVAALEEMVEDLKRHVAKIVNVDATDVTDDNYNDFFETTEEENGEDGN